MIYTEFNDVQTEALNKSEKYASFFLRHSRHDLCLRIAMANFHPDLRVIQGSPEKKSRAARPDTETPLAAVTPTRSHVYRAPQNHRPRFTKHRNLIKRSLTSVPKCIKPTLGGQPNFRRSDQRCIYANYYFSLPHRPRSLSPRIHH